MNSFASRRLRNFLLAMAGIAGITYWVHRQQASLRETSYDTGYLLLAALLLLTLYNFRKKIPVLFGSSAGWLQAHIYIGLSTAILFGLHVHWRVPDGFLESILTGLYVATFVSGLVGLYWTRALPPKLARVSEEVIYERIPHLRNQLRERAQSVVLETVRTAGATTLGEFYSHRLHDFFQRPRGLRYLLRPNNRLRRQMLEELTEVKRYLSQPEQQTCEQLFSLVRKRDDLDYQEALQWRLKAWLFVHIGLTYPLVAVACLHGWLAHVFYGGAL
ncbi:MAG: hypothetical protein MI725_00610 [Pirellulales bacterium]|nr:hypothetical protein [Pirellulales bacterium]